MLKPLRLTGLDRRGKYMLSGAWLLATLCSLPQVTFLRTINDKFYQNFPSDRDFSRTNSSKLYLLQTMHHFKVIPNVRTRSILFRFWNDYDVCATAYSDNLYVHINPHGNIQKN